MTGRERAVVAGWNGFIGHRLVTDLEARGYEVARVGRSGPDARWSDPAAVARLVDGAALVVNLAGKSVGCRYTDANRDEILRSRVDTTRQLHEAIAAAGSPPRLWLNASTATIYRYAMDQPQTESDGELGSGFSVDVARTWEDELFAGDLPGTRRVALRMAIVLGGPASDLLGRVARLGLGGPQYDGRWFQHRRYRGIGPHPTGGLVPMHRSRGRQRFSWIHIDDVLASIRFLEEHDEIEGPVNLSSPHPSDNRTLMAELRRVVRRPVGLPAARWMLEPALWVLRNESELLLKSRWVLPERLEQAGFTFRWPDLGPALEDTVGRSRGTTDEG
ncbi:MULTISPECIES: epimerase [unclassified Aeromicrobium]|uniref:epimerase n=1 Tax=unclassified Aeromicrobium TaxID=2633570 RepID=UPI00396B47FF